MISTANPEEFFLRECAAHARTLAVPDACLFLRGLMMTCEDNPATKQIRAIYDTLHHSENQLDLVHSGHMKLHFTQSGKRGGE